MLVIFSSQWEWYQQAWTLFLGKFETTRSISPTENLLICLNCWNQSTLSITARFWFSSQYHCHLKRMFLQMFPSYKSPKMSGSFSKFRHFQSDLKPSQLNKCLSDFFKDQWQCFHREQNWFPQWWLEWFH